MRNRFAGRCRECRRLVNPGEGYFEKVMGKTYGWNVRCIPCTVKGKAANGVKPEYMSRDQQRVYRELGLDLL